MNEEYKGEESVNPLVPVIEEALSLLGPPRPGLTGDEVAARELLAGAIAPAEAVEEVVED